MRFSQPVFSRRAALASALAVLAFFVVAPLRAQDPPKFQQVSDIVYKKVGDREIKLNLFLPLKDGQTLKGEPLLIYLDTGCWYSGDPGDGGVWRILGALDRGFAVASVSHRPISEAPFPAPMEDVRAAVRFLRKHAGDYGYDPERFAVCGCSSGGHLSLTLGVPDELSPYNVGENLDVSGQVQRVVDYYGPSDLAIVFDRYAKETLDCIYIACDIPREAADKADPEQFAKTMEIAKKHSPIHYVDKNFAPTIIFQGTEDPIVPLSQSALMFEAFKINGVRSRIIVADGGEHDFFSLGSVNMMKREIYTFLEW